MGDTRLHGCPRCERIIQQAYRRAAVYTADGECGTQGVWVTEPHDAPCGLPCMGGGLRGREQIRLLRETPPQVHGSSRSPCPRCGPTEREGE